MLVSGSWDKTVRVRNLLTKKQQDEIFTHSDKIAALTFRSDGKEICVSTIRGELYLWDVEMGQAKG